MSNRMIGRALVGALIVMVALAGAEAFAGTCTTSKTLSTQTCCGWKTTSSGVRYCTLWCTGSEICDNMILGLSGSFVKDCTAGVNCPVTRCSAYGTVALDSAVDCSITDPADPNFLNSACGIQGIAVCVNPKCVRGHPNDPDCSGNSSSGQPFTLDTVLTGTKDVKDCTKSGKCTNFIELDANLTDVCVNPNWEFVTFTATTFKAQACFCPGGYDTTPVADGGPNCCAPDTPRDKDGKCTSKYGIDPTLGTPTCLQQLCSIDASYDPNTNPSVPYNCETAYSCGGVTGKPCTAK